MRICKTRPDIFIYGRSSRCGRRRILYFSRSTELLKGLEGARKWLHQGTSLIRRPFQRRRSFTDRKLIVRLSIWTRVFFGFRKRKKKILFSHARPRRRIPESLNTNSERTAHEQERSHGTAVHDSALCLYHHRATLLVLYASINPGWREKKKKKRQPASLMYSGTPLGAMCLRERASNDRFVTCLELNGHVSLLRERVPLSSPNNEAR